MDKLDLYAGVRLGYDVASCSVEPDLGYNVSVGGFIYTTHIGANYFLTDNWAVNAEVGYGLASLSVGATFKF